jgi:cell division septal protein FtsQ
MESSDVTICVWVCIYICRGRQSIYLRACVVETPLRLVVGRLLLLLPLAAATDADAATATATATADAVVAATDAAASIKAFLGCTILYLRVSDDTHSTVEARHNSLVEFSSSSFGRRISYQRRLVPLLKLPAREVYVRVPRHRPI